MAPTQFDVGAGFPRPIAWVPYMGRGKGRPYNAGRIIFSNAINLSDICPGSIRAVQLFRREYDHAYPQRVFVAALRREGQLMN